MLLREATAEDIPAIIAIRLSVRENRLSDTDWLTRQLCFDYLSSESRGNTWICDDGGVVIGFSVVRIEEADVWALFVDPSHEARGAGKRLLAVAVEWLFARGINEIRLNTAPSTRADGFYARQGWRREGSTPKGDVIYRLDRKLRNEKQVTSDLKIRSACRNDTASIYGLICDLADFEKLRHEVDASEADIAEALFGANPRVFAEVAEWQGEIAGFSLWFYNYSTFRGRHGIYLEDLFVLPKFRGHGIGKALIVSLAQRCVDEKLMRLQWSVLDWNKPAIDFYASLGAKLTPEWVGCRVEGEALTKFAFD
jgi:diamine N-acetyltransferase